DADRQLLALLAGSYAQARRLARLAARKSLLARLPRGRRAWYWASALLVLALLAAWPIRQSVLAPAELVPRLPALVRAPVDGVIESFQIEPNQRVSAGQPLLRLDATEVRSKLEVATRAREVALAEFQTASQQAFSDARAKATLATLAGRVEQQAAERDYYATLLERLQLRAPQDGIAIFDDPNDWLGRPVAVGQKILVVARPEDIELEVHLPASDPLLLAAGDALLFFPNVAPDRPLGARLRVIGYTAVPGADGVAAYRLKASLDAGRTGNAADLRPGLRGTARVYGADTTLGAWLLRRPLAVLARWLNL
ncbi:MAG TPA: HlyD family efflux transporter periplasmic adaptor subunit, partial [Plasticicumulans sp.]|nr:HlyD family efflux transporter periplasmic adaptor subunit [Plasticicumulans sp.]